MLLCLHSITGLKYIYLLIICNYCVRVEEPNRLTVNQVYISIYQPTYNQSSLPIHWSTDLQSIKSAYIFINRLTVKQVYLSMYQPTYSQSSLPIYLSTDLQSSKSTYLFINRLAVNQVCLSIYQPTYSQSSLPIYLSTDLQSINQRRPPVVLQHFICWYLHNSHVIHFIHRTYLLIYVYI